MCGATMPALPKATTIWRYTSSAFMEFPLIRCLYPAAADKDFTSLSIAESDSLVNVFEGMACIRKRLSDRKFDTDDRKVFIRHSVRSHSCCSGSGASIRGVHNGSVVRCLPARHRAADIAAAAFCVL